MVAFLVLDMIPLLSIIFITLIGKEIFYYIQLIWTIK